MNTKHMLVSSSVFMGIMGVSAIFLPQEISDYMDTGSNQLSILLIQLIGALYFGFAMMNWMGKGLLIGGIYGRPIIIGNMTHFVVAALPLIKSITADSSIEILIFSLLYVIFAILFAYILFTTPKQVKGGY